MSTVPRPCAASDLVEVSALYTGSWGPPLGFDPVPWEEAGLRLGFHAAFTVRSDDDWDRHPWDHQVQGDALRYVLIALAGGWELRAGHTELAAISAGTGGMHRFMLSAAEQRAAERAGHPVRSGYLFAISRHAIRIN